LKLPVLNIWIRLHNATVKWTDCSSSFYLCWRTSAVSSSNVGTVFCRN